MHFKIFRDLQSISSSSSYIEFFHHSFDLPFSIEGWWHKGHRDPQMLWNSRDRGICGRCFSKLFMAVLVPHGRCRMARNCLGVDGNCWGLWFWHVEFHVLEQCTTAWNNVLWKWLKICISVSVNSKVWPGRKLYSSQLDSHPSFRCSSKELGLPVVKQRCSLCWIDNSTWHRHRHNCDTMMWFCCWIIYHFCALVVSNMWYVPSFNWVDDNKFDMIWLICFITFHKARQIIPDHHICILVRKLNELKLSASKLAILQGTRKNDGRFGVVYRKTTIRLPAFLWGAKCTKTTTLFFSCNMLQHIFANVLDIFGEHDNQLSLLARFGSKVSMQHGTMWPQQALSTASPKENWVEIAIHHHHHHHQHHAFQSDSILGVMNTKIPPNLSDCQALNRMVREDPSALETVAIWGGRELLEEAMANETWDVTETLGWKTSKQLDHWEFWELYNWYMLIVADTYHRTEPTLASGCECVLSFQSDWGFCPAGLKPPSKRK